MESQKNTPDFGRQILAYLGDLNMEFRGDYKVQKEVFIKKSIGKIIENLTYIFEFFDRHIESPIEKMMFLHLWYLQTFYFQGEEIVIDRQVQEGPYRIDFVVRHRRVKVGIECDGHEFHEKTKQQAARDKKRDRFLMSRGYRMIRFTGSEIHNGSADIIKEVYDIITNTVIDLEYPELR